jgi:hypothetical protein
MSSFATDLFGMPLVIAREDLEHACEVLERAWRLQAGHAPRDFDADVDRLANWFDPRLRGQTVRKRIIALPELEPGAARLPATVLLPCGDQRYLVTPEGRAWLACAREPRSASADQFVFSAEQSLPLERKLLAAYRAWSRHRINDVIEKRTGAGAPMLPPAGGIVLLLLVNRSLDRQSAIRRVREPAKQRKIDEVVADVLEPFANELAAASRRGRRREHFSLWSGYPLTEARRRLAGRLVLDSDQGLVYVDGSREDEVVEFVSHDISRRRGVTEDRIDAAFAALVEAYRGRLDDLSGLGSGFERVARTDALRERLLAAVREGS